MASANDIYRDLLALPEQERLQLVERVIHDLVDAARHRTATRATRSANAVIGLWADEPEVADEIIEDALQQRETRPRLADRDLLVGAFRRFPFGPEYQVLAVRVEASRTVVDIQLPESGEKATLPLEQTLECPQG